MFASFKGEGTGAVRHMFSHHILKPERTPLEANLWGTPKSSGAFSTLFQSRILRALDYQESPFEIRPVQGNGRIVGEKVYGDFSPDRGRCRRRATRDFANGKRAYLACGSSSKTDLPDKSVDAVVTDPPFFDNVHYSQLADFFHVWQRHILGHDGVRTRETTRCPDEVQHGDADAFGNRLGAVWRECHRVLRDDGLLIFTYHHSQARGLALRAARADRRRVRDRRGPPDQGRDVRRGPQDAGQGADRLRHHHRLPQAGNNERPSCRWTSSRS